MHRAGPYATGAFICLGCAVLLYVVQLGAVNFSVFAILVLAIVVPSIFLGLGFGVVMGVAGCAIGPEIRHRLLSLFAALLCGIALWLYWCSWEVASQSMHA